MLEIDGSYLEGGGQIVRTASSLSVLFKTPIKIINIRKNRDPPGLKRQHLFSLEFLKKISNAKAIGLSIGSQSLEFYPKDLKSLKKEVIDTKTAASISLILQAILLPCCFLDSSIKVKIIGGTETLKAPTIDYFKEIVAPYYKDFANINIEIIKRGYYPKGNGIILLSVNPKYNLNSYDSFHELLEIIRKEIPPLNLSKKEKIEEVKIITSSSNHLKQRKVCERMVKTIEKNIDSVINYKRIKYIINYQDSLSPGCSVTIVCKTKSYIFGVDNLCHIKKKSEDVALESLKKLEEEVKEGVIDKHLADNLIPILAIKGGKIKTSELTNHLLTNIWVVEKFFGKIFEINFDEKLIFAKRSF